MKVDPSYSAAAAPVAALAAAVLPAVCLPDPRRAGPGFSFRPFCAAGSASAISNFELAG